MRGQKENGKIKAMLPCLLCGCNRPVRQYAPSSNPSGTSEPLTPSPPIPKWLDVHGQELIPRFQCYSVSGVLLLFKLYTFNGSYSQVLSLCIAEMFKSLLFYIQNSKLLRLNIARTVEGATSSMSTKMAVIVCTVVQYAV